MHIVSLHRLPKMQWLHCEFCKLTRVTTEDEFKEHRVECEKKSIPVNDPPVTCEICEKVKKIDEKLIKKFKF